MIFSSSIIYLQVTKVSFSGRGFREEGYSPTNPPLVLATFPRLKDLGVLPKMCKEKFLPLRKITFIPCPPISYKG
jgi:hypothetical protein